MAALPSGVIFLVERPDEGIPSMKRPGLKDGGPTLPLYAPYFRERAFFHELRRCRICTPVGTERGRLGSSSPRKGPTHP